MLNKPFLLCDSREKPEHRYIWKESDIFAGTKIVCLENGDYCIDGLEDKKIIYIDRKRSWGEIAQNLFSKIDRDRFKECLNRIKDYKYKYILIEEVASDIFYCVALKKMRIKPDTLIKKVLEISMEYNINFLFIGASGKQWCLSILKRVYEQFKS